MANGMKMPVKASKGGGTEFLRSSRQKAKIFRLALSVGDDKNPFQNLGISEDPIFEIEDSLAVSEIRIEIERILKKFEGSIEIKPGSELKFFRRDDEGIVVQFEWIDLDTNDVGEFQIPFSQPGS